MKKFVYLGGLVLSAGLFAMPAIAANGDNDDGVTLHGEFRARYDYISNFVDFQDSATSGDPLDDDIDFIPYRVRIGAKKHFSRNVSSYIELQAQGLFGEDSSPLESPGDPLGQTTDLRTSGDVNLYQAYIDLKDIGDSVLTLRIGRQEHRLGNELMLGDLDFYNGISFDGVRAWFDWDSFNLGVYYYDISELNIRNGSILDGGDADATIFGIDGTWELGDTGGEIQPYILYYRDGQSFANDPNTPGFGVIPSGLQVTTIGILFHRPVDSREDVDRNAFDYSIEAATQTGTFDTNASDQDLGGFIAEGWGGFNWNHGRHSRSRVHIGGLFASGDDDPTDNDIGFFVPLFPDNHDYNRLGDLDLFAGALAPGSFSSSGLSTVGIGGGLGSGMTNISDINVGYEAWINDGRHYFMASIHTLNLTDNFIFGTDLNGASAGLNKNDDIGTEFDFKYKYQYNPNVGIEIGIATLSSGDLLDEISQFNTGNDADDPMRAWGQIRLRF
ncbi:MAG: alginate export family protein [Acidobacteriota bacterium]